MITIHTYDHKIRITIGVTFYTESWDPDIITRDTATATLNVSCMRVSKLDLCITISSSSN
jgi:hypothetical protein